MSLALDSINTLIAETVDSAPFGYAVPAYMEAGIAVRLTALNDARKAVMIAEMKVLEDAKRLNHEFHTICDCYTVVRDSPMWTRLSHCPACCCTLTGAEKPHVGSPYYVGPWS